jgi:hypothetical protein
MLDLQLSFSVARSSDQVFSYVATEFFDHHRLWDPAIVELTKLSEDPVGVGTRGREVRSFGGRQVADFKVTTFEPNSRFAFTNTSGGFWLDRAFIFEAQTAPSTRVTFTFVMRPRQFPLTLLAPLLRGTIERQVRTNVARLERLLDELPVGSTLSHL